MTKLKWLPAIDKIILPVWLWPTFPKLVDMSHSLYMDPSRFASKITFGFWYDCTRIFGHKVEYINSGHNGLFARLLLNRPLVL
jgi:hypothetical protein